MAAPRTRAQGNLLQENERVIITEWRLAPGSETGWHRHAHDYVGEFRFIEIELK